MMNQQEVKRIDLMYSLFGRCDGKMCKDCIHFRGYRTHRMIYKCKVYGVTNSKASDWRLMYKACGMYNMPYTQELTILDRKKLGKISCHEEDLPPIPLEGQYTMFE